MEARDREGRGEGRDAGDVIGWSDFVRNVTRLTRREDAIQRERGGQPRDERCAMQKTKGT